MVISVLKALPWLLVLALPMFLYLGSKFKIAKSIISFLLLIVVFSSCVTKKQFTYFQDLNPSTTKSDSADSKVENIIRIQPFDVLDIKIKSADKAFDNIFGNQVLSSGSSSGGAVNNTTAGTYYTGFFVDANGVTNLPLLGNVILKNLTLNQAKDLLKEKAKEYLVDPY
ncbi:MAG: polysaccharide biosynthesis/export family protein, partial [Bacteroidetes bacterium]|nr:polysaccharide biosynthesis/export family protein [Bacteroidota bacterium]